MRPSSARPAAPPVWAERCQDALAAIDLALGMIECQRGDTCSTTGSSPCCAPSCRTTCPPWSRWARSRWWTGITWTCRPPTIRNDMAVLEEQGYIVAAAHQRGPDPHRQGLPPVRRPAVRGQAAVGRRAAGDRDVPGRRLRPRRRGHAHRAPACPADPAGGGGPVSLPHQVVDPARRAGAAGGEAAAAGADHRHRPGGAAHGGAARADRGGRRHPAARGAQRLPRRADADRGSVGGRRPAGAGPARANGRTPPRCSR